LDETPEVELVRRCKAGDSGAFRILVERYRSVLFGTAFLMTRDSDMAEDAVQEALLRIWEHFSDLRREESFKIWSVRIVINEVNQLFRRRPSLLSSPEDVSGQDNHQREAEDAVVRDEECQQVRRALKRLPMEQREIVILRYFSELTIPEIAAVTGWREGTVKSRLSRALVKLGEILNGELKRGVVEGSDG